ncbi:hypothetical protein MPTK1_2g06860 [Marchantia polymorpha subsp. ruderalis]|uniref:Embryonic stem cell-specific 5-hydroxymethylcytosine-binding protein n=1 Tax=Marchantia polymorpha TaxID=3197 RepID=A0A2R6XDW0_MARPO|nr:hypothetical protein MARPO_0021s0139 [Marchantia polymorpha]BBN01360.1 hypothetical protein Mp_2g06860 [Marchantia polymorpha subsp. ruderalis]PTQ44287.1 hypothetical protein MARPO_0021s0139 [Marchantia polymorpha]PTQ44288.1 hypothetical protein MARPO_0021s0139 [Marchantia polymorpha]BBN01361.1 hypothetical protein Mp_2g06860 [Marchantia polymorpha subsp. ruderalis]|eukprot:PTQ44285.1 hypothetical protein MARPO_0021s0139 [Marchantia polymorpha]
MLNGQFNARSESVHLKSSFSRLLKKSRCVTAVEGFYEWKKDGSKKQPYYLHFEDERPLVFAALYDSWKDEEGNVHHTFTILTTRVSKALGWLHDRMPVILPNEEAVMSWLNDDLSEASLHKLTQPYEASDLVWYPVTPEMGKPSFDVPECVQEVKLKVAKESSIFQLFAKRKNMESSSQDDSRSASQVPDTTKHQSSEDGFPASQVKDEDVEIEGDRKVLKEEVGKGDVAAKEEIHGEKDHDNGHEEGVVVKDESNESEFVVNEKDHDDSHEEGVVVKNEPPESEIVVNEKDHDVSHEEGVLVKDEPHESESAYEKDHDDSHEEGVVLKDEHPESDFVVKEEVYDNDHEDQKQVLSYVKSRTGYEPEAKRRHVALPQKVTKKPAVKAVKEALSDKQTSLHSYFAKK